MYASRFFEEQNILKSKAALNIKRQVVDVLPDAVKNVFVIKGIRVSQYNKRAARRPLCNALIDVTFSSFGMLYSLQSIQEIIALVSKNMGIGYCLSLSFYIYIATNESEILIWTVFRNHYIFTNTNFL